MRRHPLPRVTMPSLGANRRTDPRQFGPFVHLQEISGSTRLRGGGCSPDRTSLHLKFTAIPRLNEDPRSRWLTPGARWIRVWLMIRPGFLSAAERGALIAVARDGLVEHRVARRVYTIFLLNDGLDSQAAGAALLFDYD